MGNLVMTWRQRLDGQPICGVFRPTLLSVEVREFTVDAVAGALRVDDGRVHLKER